MTSFPVTAKLVGEDTTNPALPSYDCTGTLTIQSCNLVFTSGGFVHKIPLEHIDEITIWHEPDMNGMGDAVRAFIVFFVGLPFAFITFGLSILVLIYFFWVEETSIEVMIFVKAWDERYGLDATSCFSLGKKEKYRKDARLIVQDIWSIRGRCRKTEQKQGRLIRRGK